MSKLTQGLNTNVPLDLHFFLCEFFFVCYFFSSYTYFMCNVCFLYPRRRSTLFTQANSLQFETKSRWRRTEFEHSISPQHTLSVPSFPPPIIFLHHLKYLPVTLSRLQSAGYNSSMPSEGSCSLSPRALEGLDPSRIASPHGVADTAVSSPCPS